MMRIATIAVLALSAAPLLAQVPDGPVAPVNAVPANSSFEFRVGAMMMSAERNSEFFSTVSKTTGSAKGVELLLRRGFFGVMLHSFTSDFGTDPNVTSADLRILIGKPVFSVQIGAGRRALWTDIGSNPYDIGIVGFTSNMRIGGTGLRGNLSIAALAPAGKETQNKMKAGIEGESSVIYTLPKLPLFLQIGYRAELFTAKAGTAPSQSEAPEELRGIRLGAGFQLGGR